LIDEAVAFVPDDVRGRNSDVIKMNLDIKNKYGYAMKNWDHEVFNASCAKGHFVKKTNL
jgi:hypothetical protein